jgi:uncharacterized protein YfaS (alpha-2-macroglobulin family)
MRTILIFIFLVFGFNGLAWGDTIVPDRRVVLHRDVDFYGSDLQTILDSTLRGCESACLANSRCSAFTFNTRNNACFLKGEAGERQEYQGAFSGELVANNPRRIEAAEARVAGLGFLTPGDFEAARTQARDLPHRFVVGGWSLDGLIAGAQDAEKEANLLSAMRFMGGAAALSDSAGNWLDYSRLLLALRTTNSSDQRDYRTRGLRAAINAYLRAASDAQEANALVLMAEALEALGRGREMIPALRLALQLAPREDTEKALDTAIGKYGFRVTQHQVDSDAATPRICAEFSENLVQSSMDYTPFVQLDVSGLAVEASGRQLCVTGVEHGGRYSMILRAGLPAESGEELVRPVTLSLYVRDRSPSVHFPGRAYVLPRSPDAGLPIVAVNVDELELTLFRLSDRNLIRSFQESYFAEPLSPWDEERFSGELAARVWQGTGLVESELNRDVTTRLPMGEAIADQPPGVYVLQAAVPGADPWSNPAATQWFVISDIGVATMLGSDGLHVFTRSLASAEAMEGAQIELVSRANAVLGEAVSDARGYAHFPAGLTAGLGGAEPALVLVRGTGGDLTFLSLSEPGFDLSDRGVEGQPPAPPIDLFLTTDRGAYRAGEVIHATALARDGRAEAIEGLPVTAVLTRPDGVEYSRHLSTGTGGGGHVFALPLGGAVPRGTWRLDLHADPDAPALVSQTLLVEDFLPERIDFTMALPEGDIRAGDAFDLSVEARYLFGAPGADLAIEGDVILRGASEIAGWPGYRFGHYDRPVQVQWGSIPGGVRTDAQGLAVLPVDLPDTDAAGVPLEAQINLRVAEGSGRPVERSITSAIIPDGPMIGLKPLFEDELPEGGEAAFSVIALSPDLYPTDMAVSWTLNRVTTRYQWYRLQGHWNWEPITTRTRIASGEAMLGAEPVILSHAVDWGRYELVVERVGGTYLFSAQSFYAGWYGATDSATTPDMLEVSLDADSYKPGDTATLRLVPRTPGKALVTVMSNRLIDMIAVDVVEGENKVEIPVTDEWGAGAYVTATVIQPMDTTQGRNPTRALGLTHAAVDPGLHQLIAKLEAPEAANPRGPLEVALKVEGIAPGETAYATIAAVDVGILNLTSFQSPDPSGHYFGQRRLGMSLRDLYGRLIDGMNGAMGQVRSGGDAMAQMRMQAPPPTEELMAQFSGVLTVGEDGYARASFDLPEFNGSVRLMAVVWSKTGVGEDNADVLVRDPVVLTASLPRFMAPGDEARMLLELVHATGPAGEMAVTLASDGVALAGADLPLRVTLAEGGTARFSVPVTAEMEGIHTISLTLITPDGQRLTKTLTLPVMSNDPEISRTSRFMLAAGDSFTFDANVFAGMRPGSGKATLTAGALARFNAPALLERLDRYPYGCTEQLTSRALPLLYFGTVAEALGLDTGENIPARIADAIDKVLSNQSSGGGFGLWYPDSGDLWLDAYVSDFLSRARAQGYSVPDVAFRAAMDNLRNRVNYHPDFDAGGEALAYALYVLAREGAAAMGDLRYYADVKGGAFTTPLGAAQLGAALASYGDPERADRMFARAARQIAQAQPDTTQIWRSDYGTSLRDAAAVLTLAVEAGSSVIDREALVARAVRDEGWLSTQEALWSLLAANALIGEAVSQGGLTVNGEAMTGPLVTVLDSRTASGALDIHNGGADVIELTLTSFGVPSEPEPAGGQGYTIERRYFDMEGNPVEIASVAQGARMVAVLTIQPHGGSGGRLMVTDPLPAGFEIDNPNLIRGGDIKALDWLNLNSNTETTEFRQDRFLAAVDWTSEESFRIGYVVRAVTPGIFHHPAASVEDMYRPTYRARGETGRVRITE